MKEDFLMTLNKAEAIHTLAVHMGISDGHFSKDEISRLYHICFIILNWFIFANLNRFVIFNN